MATPTPKKKSKLSLNEFRAWLAGVEEMQADDWTPDPTQWRRIREKIEDVIDNPRFNSGGAGPSNESEQPARVIRPAGPSLLGPSAAAPGTPLRPPSFMNTEGTEGVKLKTPNIDTSATGYSSSLE